MREIETGTEAGEAIVNGIMFAVCIYGAIFFAWEVLAWLFAK